MSFNRHNTKDMTSANFEAYPRHVLNISLVAAPAIHVSDKIDCALQCLVNMDCFSFNFAVVPNINGLHVCQLLATDKYNHSNSFLPSPLEFDHFAIMVWFRFLR